MTRQAKVVCIQAALFIIGLCFAGGARHKLLTMTDTSADVAELVACVGAGMLFCFLSAAFAALYMPLAPTARRDISGKS
jgi:hypothetical protein